MSVPLPVRGVQPWAIQRDVGLRQLAGPLGSPAAADSCCARRAPPLVLGRRQIAAPPIIASICSSLPSHEQRQPCRSRQQAAGASPSRWEAWPASPACGQQPRQGTGAAPVAAAPCGRRCWALAPTAACARQRPPQPLAAPSSSRPRRTRTSERAGEGMECVDGGCGWVGGGGLVAAASSSKGLCVGRALAAAPPLHHPPLSPLNTQGGRQVPADLCARSGGQD